MDSDRTMMRCHFAVVRFVECLIQLLLLHLLLRIVWLYRDQLTGWVVSVLTAALSCYTCRRHER